MPLFFIAFALAVIGFVLIISFYISCVKKITGVNFRSYRSDILKMIAANLFLFLIVVAISFLTGYKNAYDHFEQAEGIAIHYETFYTEILEINGRRISVSGLDVNKSAYQGEFILTPYGETSLERENHPIAISDLHPGQLVSVTLIFLNVEENTSNNELPNIDKIEILHDNSGNIE